MKKIKDVSSIRRKLQKEFEEDFNHTQSTYGGITVGTLVDTDDPQQMGRIKVFCAAFGDSYDDLLENLPWAIYGSPFGGAVNYHERGAENDISDGQVSYGIWAIPKVGASVLVMCIDGNPDYRVWLGCIYNQYLPHTMPHGRFNENFEGAHTSKETPIQPLTKNYEKAFGTLDATNHEWKTRGADFQVAAVDNIRTHGADTVNQKSDKLGLDTDETTQGYLNNRQNINLGMKDSQRYSITTPGFHSFSMDDSIKNCRIRCRTTSGHQIILDDTNERIYISSAKGENWIEMDSAGNIDMFTSGNFSVHAEKDINFTANKEIKMYAKEGINIKSEKQIKIQSDEDLNLRSNMNINTKCDLRMDTHVGTQFKMQVDDTYHVLSTGNAVINTNAVLYTTSVGNTFINGAQVHLNSGGGGVTVPAYSNPFVETAYVPSKVPEHEPWGRISTKIGYPQNESQFDTNILIGLGLQTGISQDQLEVPYDSEHVGKVDRGTQVIRNEHWRR